MEHCFIGANWKPSFTQINKKPHLYTPIGNVTLHEPIADLILVEPIGIIIFTSQ